MSEIDLTRKFLKERLHRDYIAFRGCKNEWKTIYDLLQRTAEIGESNSALLIGPKGSGKTSLISSVVHSILCNEKQFHQNAIIVCLNGLIHTDDRLALKSATIQLNLENAVNGKVFGSFAENFSFLLACLKSGDQKSKSVVFIIEEFDLFCSHHNQTLLYNLFDVSQSAQTPVCVLGITCRLDVIELLEKRVKSRFSHRQIFLFSQIANYEEYTKSFGDLLKLPTAHPPSSSSTMTRKKIINTPCSNTKFDDDNLKLLENNFELYTLGNLFNKSKYQFTKEHIDMWNEQIDNLICDNGSVVTKILQNLYDYDVSEAFLKKFLFKIVSKIGNSTNKKYEAMTTVEENSSNSYCYIKLNDIKNAYYKEFEIDDKILSLCELSVLELCLVIAMKHHSEIYNRDPFNFEIIYNRFMKFAKTSTIMQGIERIVVFKGYEHLRNLEFIIPVTNNYHSSKLQKEFQMHKLLLSNNQIDKSVLKYDGLPTEVTQWAQSSLL